MIGEANFAIDENETFIDPGATAVDAEGNNLSLGISGTVDTSMPGVYSINYIAGDSWNRTSTITRKVKVLGDPRVLLTSSGQSYTLTPGIGVVFADSGGTNTNYDDGETYSITFFTTNDNSGVFTLTTLRLVVRLSMTGSESKFQPALVIQMWTLMDSRLQPIAIHLGVHQQRVRLVATFSLPRQVHWLALL
jgi:hypothetical protein